MFVGTPKFRTSYQKDDYSCGARCVYMILRHFGRKVKYSRVKDQCLTTVQNGTNVSALIGTLRFYGLKVGARPRMAVRGLRKALKSNAVVLVHVDGDHFAVVHGRDHRFTYIADPDPSRGKIKKHNNAVFAERFTRWGLVVSDPVMLKVIPDVAKSDQAQNS